MKMKSMGQNPRTATLLKNVIKFNSRLKISKMIKRMMMRKPNMEQPIVETKLKSLTKMEESLKQLLKREKRGRIN